MGTRERWGNNDRAGRRLRRRAEDLDVWLFIAVVEAVKLHCPGTVMIRTVCSECWEWTRATIQWRTATSIVGRRGHNATSKSRLQNRSRVLKLRSRVLELRSRVFESTDKRTSGESRGPLFTTCYLYCKVATSDKAITKFVIFLHDTTFAERYVSEDEKW